MPLEFLEGLAEVEETGETVSFGVTSFVEEIGACEV